MKNIVILMSILSTYVAPSLAQTVLSRSLSIGTTMAPQKGSSSKEMLSPTASYGSTINPQPVEPMSAKLYDVLKKSGKQGRANSMGGVDSGGGTVVLCPNARGGSMTFELLDFQAARQDLGYKIDLGPADLGYVEKVDFALNRLAAVAPLRASLYKKWFMEFENESDRRTRSKVINSQGLGGVSIPEGCYAVDVVTQKTDSVLRLGGKRYTIDQDVFDRLDNDTKAGLILHELVYRDRLMGGALDATETRMFTSLISTRQIVGSEYWDAVKFGKLPFGEIFGAAFFNNDKSPNEKLGSDVVPLTEFMLVPESTIRIPNLVNCKIDQSEYTANLPSGASSSKLLYVGYTREFIDSDIKNLTSLDLKCSKGENFVSAHNGNRRSIINNLSAVFEGGVINDLSPHPRESSPWHTSFYLKNGRVSIKGPTIEAQDVNFKDFSLSFSSAVPVDGNSGSSTQAGWYIYYVGEPIKYKLRGKWITTTNLQDRIYQED